MKALISILVISLVLFSCNSGKTTIKSDSYSKNQSTKTDTIRIANDELEYEILIIEIGFDSWLETQPPMGHHGLSFLESKNRMFVLEYNNRVFKDRTRKLYEAEINYDSTVSYGLEVNYLLYNYFKYFQQKYKQKL